MLDPTKKALQLNQFWKWRNLKQWIISTSFLKYFICYFASRFTRIFHMIHCHILSIFKPVICFQQGYDFIFKMISSNFITNEINQMIMNRKHKHSLFISKIQLRSIKYWFSYFINLCKTWRDFIRSFFLVIK